VWLGYLIQFSQCAAGIQDPTDNKCHSVGLAEEIFRIVRKMPTHPFAITVVISRNSPCQCVGLVQTLAMPMYSRRLQLLLLIFAADVTSSNGWASATERHLAFADRGIWPESWLSLDKCVRIAGIYMDSASHYCKHAGRERFPLLA
jgi:hypothetical protein